MDNIRKYFTSLKMGTEHLNYGRNILCEYAIESIMRNKKKNVKILDLGSGIGMDLLNIKESLECFYKNKKVNNFNIELNAIETFSPNLEKLKDKKINTFNCNIENEKLPFKDNSIDIVICNQIIEHTKEIFWIFSEIGRVLKVKDEERGGGICIMGVPNLASLHNRIALLFGIQPTSIEILGPHIRGITKKSFINFIETKEFFKVRYVKGSNFYPFKPNLSGILSKLFPTMSVSIFFYIERTSNTNGSFIDILDDNLFETPYYRGNKI